MHFFKLLSNIPLICHRAIYFAAYSTAKEKLNGVLEPDSTQVHMVSAGMAGNDLSRSSSLLSVCHCLLLSVIPACLSVCPSVSLNKV